MQTAVVDVYANHQLLYIGTTDWPPDIGLDDGPANADSHHVAVRTRGQIRHTRVTLWSRTMPLAGEVVFDGELDLADYTICVGDLERLGRWTQRIEKVGRQRVVVLVDDPGNASRVQVGLGLGTQVRSLPSVAGYPLPDVLTSEAEDAGHPAVMGLVLDGHDSPHARLAAAIKLVSKDDRPALEGYNILELVEWLRWLGVGLSLDRATELGEMIRRQMRDSHPARESGGRDSLTDEAAISIAHTIIDQIT